MKLCIQDEFGVLKSAVICFGEHIPTYGEYKSDDLEFTKYHPYSWNKNLLLKQQEAFFKILEKYGVKLIFLKTDPRLQWQMYARDTAFVIGERLYYPEIRKFQERNGEIETLLEALELSKDQIIPIKNEIEGGDVLVTGKNSAHIGHGSRTNPKAIESIKTHVQTKVFELGFNVMHLDTRLTLLPNNIVLANLSAFEEDSLKYLNTTYDVIEITDKETKKLGTNVLVINPETILVPTQHTRIGDILKEKGFKVEIIEYTEPINLGGSFRCTILPIERI